MGEIKETPILAIFYALGYASGNVVGIKIEKWLSIGDALLRIICFRQGDKIVERLRQLGYTVVTFSGCEAEQSVLEIEIPCRRSEIQGIIDIAREFEPRLYYVTEAIGISPREKLPLMQPASGWRAVFKRK
jgi:uncharacterized protein YebE (UPF0316 family)